MQFTKSQNDSSPPGGARVIRQSLTRHRRRVLACFAIAAALAGVVGTSQQAGNPNANGSPKGTVMPGSQRDILPDPNQQMIMQQQQAKKQNIELVNTERKKLLADESALLLKLATELKTEVDKTDKDTLSVSVIRKADTIEKLAHDVKDKMKLSVGTN